VRELENLVERLIVTSTALEIDATSVRAAIAPVAPIDPVEVLAAASVSLADLEQRYAAAVLRRTHGNKVQAASILGIDLSTLYRRDKQRRP
jgi:DNA-binding NtrC family response regulator